MARASQGDQAAAAARDALATTLAPDALVCARGLGTEYQNRYGNPD